MGQMFYSLSLGMGITITYGSYMGKQDSIERSARRIDFFDTLIAVVAGLMIVPVVYMFAVKTGTPVMEAMSAGSGLIFTTLPKTALSLHDPVFRADSHDGDSRFRSLSRL